MKGGSRGPFTHEEEEQNQLAQLDQLREMLGSEDVVAEVRRLQRAAEENPFMALEESGGVPETFERYMKLFCSHRQLEARLKDHQENRAKAKADAKKEAEAGGSVAYNDATWQNAEEEMQTRLAELTAQLAAIRKKLHSFTGGLLLSSMSGKFTAPDALISIDKCASLLLDSMAMVYLCREFTDPKLSEDWVLRIIEPRNGLLVRKLADAIRQEAEKILKEMQAKAEAEQADKKHQKFIDGIVAKKEEWFAARRATVEQVRGLQVRITEDSEELREVREKKDAAGAARQQAEKQYDKFNGLLAIAVKDLKATLPSDGLAINAEECEETVQALSVESKALRLSLQAALPNASGDIAEWLVEAIKTADTKRGELKRKIANSSTDADEEMQESLAIGKELTLYKSKQAEAAKLQGLETLQREAQKRFEDFSAKIADRERLERQSVYLRELTSEKKIAFAQQQTAESDLLGGDKGLSAEESRLETSLEVCSKRLKEIATLGFVLQGASDFIRALDPAEVAYLLNVGKFLSMDPTVDDDKRNAALVSSLPEIANLGLNEDVLLCLFRELKIPVITEDKIREVFTAVEERSRTRRASIVEMLSSGSRAETKYKGLRTLLNKLRDISGPGLESESGTTKRKLEKDITKYFTQLSSLVEQLYPRGSSDSALTGEKRIATILEIQVIKIIIGQLQRQQCQFVGQLGVLGPAYDKSPLVASVGGSSPAEGAPPAVVADDLQLLAADVSVADGGSLESAGGAARRDSTASTGSFDSVLHETDETVLQEAGASGGGADPKEADDIAKAGSSADARAALLRDIEARRQRCDLVQTAPVQPAGGPLPPLAPTGETQAPQADVKKAGVATDPRAALLRDIAARRQECDGVQTSAGGLFSPAPTGGAQAPKTPKTQVAEVVVDVGTLEARKAVLAKMLGGR